MGTDGRTKSLIFALALVPLGTLVLGLWNDGLGANPIETVTHTTGEWALRFLLVTLAVTPVRRLTGWNRIIRFRRMLGLFAFFYACLHLTTYLILDQFFDWRAIVEDVLERPYITAGVTAFSLLVPLAVTSTNAWIRRLGRNWQRLHRLVYAAAVMGVLHFVWLTRADQLEPVVYGVILGVLLAYRLLPTRAGKRNRSAGKAAGPQDPQQEGASRWAGLRSRARYISALRRYVSKKHVSRGSTRPANLASREVGHELDCP